MIIWVRLVIEEGIVGWDVLDVVLLELEAVLVSVEFLGGVETVEHFEVDSHVLVTAVGDRDGVQLDIKFDHVVEEFRVPHPY